MAYFVTMALAIEVAWEKSLEAPANALRKTSYKYCSEGKISLLAKEMLFIQD